MNNVQISGEAASSFKFKMVGSICFAGIVAASVGMVSNVHPYASS